MDVLESPVYRSQDRAVSHLIPTIYEVLEEILMRCKSTACQYSALHGLGHMALNDTKTVEPIIRRFLREGIYADKVKEYAEEAITGYIQ
ncbi:MAG: hypothetical protein AAGA25_16450 [Planctomycetota bacterium]